ncbi:MAG: 30S ribosomal protein S4e [Candidatus Aenigmarchaeota archaeon]|nr:30S ribosomal protein S4e [Candidatus Aenigmarchaeota archaeon]
MKLKRLLAPKFWKQPKKVLKYTVSPRPGPHKKFECIPLLIIVRDILKLAETGKEAKRIIKSGEILVDGRKRKDHAYPVGLMDVISIPKIDKHFRILPGEKGLEVLEISKEEANLKICRINNKTAVKGGKIQLNLHDGRNILIEKEKDEYKTGDSVMIEIPSQKILKHIVLKPGSVGIILKGQNSGKKARVEEMIERRSLKDSRKIICSVDDKKVEISKDYFFVVE